MIKLKKYKFNELYQMSSGISSKPEQAGHGAPFVSFRTVFNNYFLPNELPDLMDTSLKEQQVYSIKKGDILMTRTSETLDELGMSCVAIKEYPAATYSGFSKRLRPIKEGVVYEKYMAFYLRSKLFRTTMTNNAIMTLRASFNEDIFSYLNLYLPDYQYQKKIGDFLFLLESKIKLNNRINIEFEAMAKTVYDYWFVQFDFPFDFAQGKPSAEGKPYKSNGGKMIWSEELKREIPEGWEVKNFGNFLFQVSDNIEPDDYKQLNYLPIDKLPTKKLYYDEYENRENANSSLIRFKEDDILLGGMRVYFHRVCNAIEDGISRSTLIVLRAHQYIYKNISLFTLNRTETIEFATKNSTGTSIPYAKWNNGLAQYKVCFPTEKNLLLHFNDIITPILEKFKILSKENQQLSSLRDWLLPMLMNGQVSVGEDKEFELSMAAEPKTKYGNKNEKGNDLPSR